MPTLEQIQEKMKKLQVQADTLIAKKAQAAVDQIRKIMLTHGLTTDDIEVKAKAKREAKAANGSTSNVQSEGCQKSEERDPAEVSTSQDRRHLDRPRSRAGVDCGGQGSQPSS